MKFENFIGGSYESQSFTADQERTINFYVEQMEVPGATSRTVLYPTPGLRLLSGGVASGGGRAHFFMNGREFAVYGTTFWEVSSTGVFTSRGTVATNANPATISSNGDSGGQIFITSGGNGYTFTLSSGAFAQVAFLNGKATMGAHLDGYFLALDTLTSTFYVSNLLDGLTWQSTQFARRSIAPDRWASMKVLGRYIWLLGEQTSEVWYNTGSTPFTFAPHPSGLILYGISAPFSVVTIANEIIWLGALAKGTSQVLRASGFSPEGISSFPLQSAITDYIDATTGLSSISDAVAYAYAERGHSFYLLTFPTQNVTWAWDAQSRLWAERATWIAEENKWVAWRPRWPVYAFGEYRVLDSTGGNMYSMTTVPATNVVDVDDRPLRRLRRAPALVAENERIYYSAFELELDRAQQLTSSAVAPPQVMMRMSDDGGKTWGIERMRSAGSTGEYNKRVRWNRLGSSRRRVFEITVSDKEAWRITGAYLTLGQQPNLGQQQQASA